MAYIDANQFAYTRLSMSMKPTGIANYFNEPTQTSRTPTEANVSDHTFSQRIQHDTHLVFPRILEELAHVISSQNASLCAVSVSQQIGCELDVCRVQSVKVGWLQLGSHNLRVRCRARPFRSLYAVVVTSGV